MTVAGDLSPVEMAFSSDPSALLFPTYQHCEAQTVEYTRKYGNSIVGTFAETANFNYLLSFTDLGKETSVFYIYILKRLYIYIYIFILLPIS